MSQTLLPKASSIKMEPIIAQNSTPSNNLGKAFSSDLVLNYLPIGLAFLFLLLFIYNQSQLQKQKKALKFEEYKYKDIKKKLKLALITIQKMETNPDLVHSREFNLDYLRMRMDEEVFHYVIVNQIKIKVRQIITQALRPDTKKESTVGIANTSGRKVEKTFDVTYEIETQGKWKTNVLFRVQIKLTKLPIRTSSSTVEEIIDCVERYLCPRDDQDNWTPTINNRIVLISWDQKARPTPLLVIEQAEEGSATIRNNNWRRPSDNSKSTPGSQVP